MEKRPLDSFEFNCSISGTLLCEIGSTMAYVKDNDFLFVNPNVIHKSLENSASFLGFAVLVPRNTSGTGIHRKTTHMQLVHNHLFSRYFRTYILPPVKLLHLLETGLREND